MLDVFTRLERDLAQVSIDSLASPKQILILYGKKEPIERL